MHIKEVGAEFLEFWVLIHSNKRFDSLPEQNLPERQQSAICWNFPGLFRDYGLNHIFFRNKTFLFFKIENWNRISWNLTNFNTFGSFSSFRQLLFSFFPSNARLSLNFVTFHKILYQTDVESFSFLSWKTKTFYS